MGAAATCEMIRDGFLAQPVNAVTALAISFAGLVVAGRPPVRWVGLAMVAAGLGSFLSHGPMPPYADWVHDVTLATLILVIAGVALGREAWAAPAGLVGFGAAFAVLPSAASPAVGVLTAGAIGLLLLKDRSGRTIGPLLLLGVSAVIGRLGDTGGPLCDPASLIQPHALWHLGAAAAVAWWALGRAAHHSPLAHEVRAVERS